MPIDKKIIDNLEQGLGGLADVLGVGLIITDHQGQALTGWQYPVDEDTLSINPQIVDVDGIEYREMGVAVEVNGEEHRRFVVQVPEIEGCTIFVQSEILPDQFPWLDGKIVPPELPGCEFSIEQGPQFLLGLFVQTICLVVAKKAVSMSVTINDLDVENIRRIGVCLRKKIAYDKDSSRKILFSLGGVPNLEALFMLSAEGGRTLAASSLLTKIFKHVTVGVKGSFNLMSLTCDFVIQSPWFTPLCTKVIRKHFGIKCFASDVECLIEATLLGRMSQDIPMCICKKCHAGFTEVLAPIFINGLIVGLMFGGQLVKSEEDADNIMRYAGTKEPKMEEMYSKPVPIGEQELEQTKQLVSGLAALIGLLFERYCVAEKWAALGKALVDLRIEEQREIFQTACHAVKRLLAASEVSAFRLERDLLILEATTSKEVGIRQKAGDRLESVPSEEAIGKAFYRKGEGLTGRVVSEGKSRFERDATKAEGWAGLCSEGREPKQFFAAPILRDDRCYGILRAVRPSNFTEFPKSDRVLIERFASELGIVLHNYDLTKAETENFKEKAEELQTLLAEAAHEYMGPLHNVLSLSTGIQCTLDIEQLKRLRQRMKEEVYRAKRIMENYLLRGVSGREKLKYDFKMNDLGTLLKECVTRFKARAAKKGIVIKTDWRINQLPKVTFDYDRMDQVFSNIIDNAVKYAFDSTEIVIKGKDKDNTVTVSVMDMGLGIPKEAMKEIFEGYQRSVEDKRRFKPGTGLGLMIAKEIVQTHRGSITIESRAVWDDPVRLACLEGYETKFVVSLPKQV